MGKPTFKQAWMPLLLAGMTFATAYLGNDKWQASQEPTTVTVNVESMPAGTIRSNADINAMIDRAIEARMDTHLNDEGRH